MSDVCGIPLKTCDDVRDHIGLFKSFSPPCVVYFCVFRRIQGISPKIAEFLVKLHQNGAKSQYTQPVVTDVVMLVGICE